jgi:hypothetical protein
LISRQRRRNESRRSRASRQHPPPAPFRDPSPCRARPQSHDLGHFFMRLIKSHLVVPDDSPRGTDPIPRRHNLFGPEILRNK